MGTFFDELQRSKAFGNGKPKEEKKVYIIPKQSKKQKEKLKEEKPARDEQNEWFVAIEVKEFKKGFCNCWNCGEKIPKAFARAATAHVLPKRNNQFPSVKTHPENYLILGAGCGCHNRYDRSWEDAAQMKVWPLAVEKFNIIYPFIAAKEKKNIPEELLQELDPGAVSVTLIDPELKTIVVEEVNTRA